MTFGSILDASWSAWVLNVMEFGEAVASCLSNYASVRGRASRSEYWWFTLAIVLAYAAAIAVDAELRMGLFTTLVSLGTFLPSTCVGIRRFHDMDRSGWWFLIALAPFAGPILLLIWFCKKGTVGINDFGKDPLGHLRPPSAALRGRRDNDLVRD